MNRLALAERIRQECRISGTGPATTEGTLTGEIKKIVDWMDLAYEDIQRLHNNWNFLLEDISVAMASGARTYTLATLSLTNLKNWILHDGVTRLYTTATGVTDEQEIYYLPYDIFKRQYLFGSARNETGRPGHFTINPQDNSIMFDYITNAAYTLVGEYFRKPYTMTLDADTPAFPGDDFDILILWRTLIFYARDYLEPTKEEAAIQEYDRILGALQLDQLPPFEWGEPLA